MQMRLMALEEAMCVYEQFLVKDFPKDEVKPFSIIRNLMEKGLYHPYGFYEGEQLKAYAWVTRAQDSEMMLLDYLAVCAYDRGQGIGSQCLKMLGHSQIAPQGLIIEAENIDFALNKEQRQIRERRVQFYLRNGLWQTSLHTCVYGVEYLILVMGKKRESQTVLQDLEKIYHVLLTDEKYQKHVRLNSLECHSERVASKEKH